MKDAQAATLIVTNKTKISADSRRFVFPEKAGSIGVMSTVPGEERTKRGGGARSDAISARLRSYSSSQSPYSWGGFPCNSTSRAFFNRGLGGPTSSSFTSKRQPAP